MPRTVLSIQKASVFFSRVVRGVEETVWVAVPGTTPLCQEHAIKKQKREGGGEGEWQSSILSNPFFSNTHFSLRTHDIHMGTHTETHAHKASTLHHRGPRDLDENIFHLAQLGIKHPSNPT